MTVEKIRVSIGSAAKLGLLELKMDVQPTNCHMLTYREEGCTANCAFCPQSYYTSGKLGKGEYTKFLSRVVWPLFNFGDVLDAFRCKFPVFSTDDSGFRRICIQSLNYRGFKEDVIYIISSLKNVTTIPISVAVPPVDTDTMYSIKEAGAERIAFALDAATPSLFDLIKGKRGGGPYKWEMHIDALEKAVQIFGKGYVSTHLIIGLGETEYEALKFIEDMKKRSIRTGLFAFVPMKYTRLADSKRPDIITFRKIQLGKYLIETGRRRVDDFEFDDGGRLITFNIDRRELEGIVSLGIPFMTSGCPGCNRPYYTSRPGEEQYNFPYLPDGKTLEIILEELLPFVEPPLYGDLRND